MSKLNIKTLKKPTTARQRLLDAILASDSQSPFVSPTQLADALNALLTEIADLIGKRIKREWVSKEDLKRAFGISEYYCRTILTKYQVPFQLTETGAKRYSFSQFEKAVEYGCV